MEGPNQSTQDAEHLRLLALFHRILGGILALFGCFPGIYVFMGAMFLASPPPSKGHDSPPPEWLGGLFISIGLIGILVVWALAICVYCVAGQLDSRTRYGYCFAIAIIECLFQPLGTALGVFSLIVLTRPSVKALFR